MVPRNKYSPGSTSSLEGLMDRGGDLVKNYLSVTRGDFSEVNNYIATQPGGGSEFSVCLLPLIFGIACAH